MNPTFVSARLRSPNADSTSRGNGWKLNPKASRETPQARFIQTKRVEGNDPGKTAIPPIVGEVLHSPGEPLDSATRQFMESRFGHDFSRVRVHADGRAADSSRAVGANAYTAGPDVVFGPGRYEPASTQGRRLLAHELTHVVQQQAGIQLQEGVGPTDGACERRADAVADLVVDGEQAGPVLGPIAGSVGSGSAGAAGYSLMRQPVQQTAQTQGPLKQTQPNQATGNPPAYFQQGFQKMIKEWAKMHEIKDPIARQLAHAYVTRPGTLLELPDVIPDSQYGGTKTIRRAHAPGEQRVYTAIYNALDITKTGKGWEWNDAPARRKKTPIEQGKEVAKWEVERVADDLKEKYIEEPLVGYLEKPLVKATAEWLTEREMAVVVSIFTGADWLIGTAMLILEVRDLVVSLGEPAELSAYEKLSSDIVAGVQAWLQRKEEAAEVAESVKRGPSFTVKPTTSERVIRRPP